MHAFIRSIMMEGAFKDNIGCKSKKGGRRSLKAAAAIIVLAQRHSFRQLFFFSAFIPTHVKTQYIKSFYKWWQRDLNHLQISLDKDGLIKG